MIYPGNNHTSVLCFTTNTTYRNERCVIQKPDFLKEIVWFFFNVRHSIRVTYAENTEPVLPMQKKQVIIQKEPDNTRKHATLPSAWRNHILYSRTSSGEFCIPKWGPATHCQMLLFSISPCKTWWQGRRGYKWCFTSRKFCSNFRWPH